MLKMSAGLVVYRRRGDRIEILLVHPGGPFWAKKDIGAWSIPKGEIAGPEEDLLSAAKREFKEEIGSVPDGEFMPLGSVKQKGGKIIHAWAIQESVDIKSVESNLFEIEWPPKSGKFQKFPEVDRAEFFNLSEAKQKINPAQIDFLKRLEKLMTKSD